MATTAASQDVGRYENAPTNEETICPLFHGFYVAGGDSVDRWRRLENELAIRSRLATESVDRRCRADASRTPNFASAPSPLAVPLDPIRYPPLRSAFARSTRPFPLASSHPRDSVKRFVDAIARETFTRRAFLLSRLPAATRDRRERSSRAPLPAEATIALAERHETIVLRIACTPAGSRLFSPICFRFCYLRDHRVSIHVAISSVGTTLVERNPTDSSGN